jgi:hypothetical protein
MLSPRPVVKLLSNALLTAVASLWIAEGYAKFSIKTHDVPVLMLCAVLQTIFCFCLGQLISLSEAESTFTTRQKSSTHVEEYNVRALKMKVNWS